MREGVSHMSGIGHPQEGEYPPRAKPYISQVDSDDVVQVLTGQVGKTLALLRGIGEEHSSLPYAPGKWTFKQTVGHMSDTERIFAYRALRIARGDTTPLPGFEQDDYVRNAGSNQLGLDDLLREFAVVREATLALVRRLPEEAWVRSGITSDASATVRGLVFVIAGHELHHYRILQEHASKSTRHI
jgi:hypothetical protein